MIVGIACAVALLCAASSAAAAQRYAAPNGSGSACSSGSPCAIGIAFSGANNGDEIILAAGDYNAVSSNLFVPSNGFAHGVHGQPAPRIHFASGRYMDSGTTGSRLSYVQIDGITPEPFNADSGSVADQIWVHATGNSACLVYGTLLDSVCWTSSAGDDAINGGVSATFTPVLRNVTAESTGTGGTGINYHASGGGNITISADQCDRARRLNGSLRPGHFSG